MKYNNTLRESWATFVEKILTIHDYKEWIGSDPFTNIDTHEYPGTRTYDTQSFVPIVGGFHLYPDNYSPYPPFSGGGSSGVPPEVETPGSGSGNNGGGSGGGGTTGTPPVSEKRYVDFEEVNNLNIQSWLGSAHGYAYTSLFIDIHDNSNQREYFRLTGVPLFGTVYTDYVNDNVCFNNIPKIEDIVFSSRNLSAVKSKLKAARTGYSFSEQDVDNLFQSFER